jgi:hypothetical protein
MHRNPAIHKGKRMNTTPLTSPPVGTKSHATATAPVRKDGTAIKNRNLDERSSLQKAKSTNRAAIMSSLKTAEKLATSKNADGKDEPEISDYLKTISRFENKVKKDEITEEDLDKILQSLEDRILDLDEQDKTKLKDFEFFKQHKIENLNELKKTLVDLFNDPIEQEAFFDFLKSQEFMTILLAEENGKPPSYAPPKPGININAKSEAMAAANLNQPSAEV